MESFSSIMQRRQNDRKEYATTSVKTMCMFQELNGDLFIEQILTDLEESLREKEN